MKKKGQLTIFLILSVLLILILLIFFILRNSSESLGDFKSEFYEVKNYVDSCLQMSLINGLEFYGIQDIDYNSENQSNLTFISIPYIYYWGERRDLSLENVEEILSIYVESYFEDCINNFTNLNNKTYEVVVNKKPEFLVEIKSEVITVNLDFPLRILKGETRQEIKKFDYSFDFDFYKINQILSNFVDEQDETPNFIPVGYITMLSNEENVVIQMINLPDDVVIFIFIFEDDRILDNPYVFLRAVKYDWDLSNEGQTKTRDVDNLIAYVGEQFYYEVQTDLSDPMFTDYSPLFDISEHLGEVEFVPILIDVGVYNYLIRIYNDDEEEFVNFKLEVKKNETISM